MRVLVWQWGRRGAGPLVATALARELGAMADVTALLSLSTLAELLRLSGAVANDVPVNTYQGWTGFAGRLLASPWMVRRLARRIRMARVDVAICAMPAPLDFAMAAALRHAGVPYAVVVHDAQLHPGDSYPLQIALQRWLLRGSGAIFALSSHVAGQLRANGMRAAQTLDTASLPPFVVGDRPPPVGTHAGRFRLLSFGRLMPYKGLDLLADAMALLHGRDDVVLRVVGFGPEGAELDRLRALPNVTVENRWVPEDELSELLGWADALVLTHREASQSGVAAAAVMARRWVVATGVGGLAEQLRDEAMAVVCDADPAQIAAAIAALPGAVPPPAKPDQDWSGTAAAIAARLRALT